MILSLKVNKCNLSGQQLGKSSSMVCLMIFKRFDYVKPCRGGLRDFQVDHKKFIMLLRFSEYKNRQTANVCKQDCRVSVGVARNQTFLVEWESDSFGGVRFFYLTPTPEVQVNHFLHNTSKLRIPVEMIQFFFEIFIET